MLAEGLAAVVGTLLAVGTSVAELAVGAAPFEAGVAANDGGDVGAADRGGLHATAATLMAKHDRAPTIARCPRLPMVGMLSRSTAEAARCNDAAQAQRVDLQPHLAGHAYDGFRPTCTPRQCRAPPH